MFCRSVPQLLFLAAISFLTCMGTGVRLPENPVGPKGPPLEPLDLTEENFNNETFRRDTAWLVYYYSSSPACEAFIPEFLALAGNLTAMFRINVGQVDADEEETLAKAAGFKDHPILQVIRGEGDNWQSMKYKGKMTTEAISRFLRRYSSTHMGFGKPTFFLEGNALEPDDYYFEIYDKERSIVVRGMPQRAKEMGYVLALTAQNFQQNVLDSKEAWLVVFYDAFEAKSQNLSPEMAIAGIHLSGKIRIGAVDVRVYPELAGRYGIERNNLPAGIYFTAKKPQSEEFEPVSLSERMSWESLVELLEHKTGAIPPPKADVFRVHEEQEILTSLKKRGTGHLPASMTVLPMFCNGECRNASLKFLQNVANINRRLNWNYFWAEEGDLPSIEKEFGLESFGLPATVTIAGEARFRTSSLKDILPFQEVIYEVFYGNVFGVFFEEKAQKNPKIEEFKEVKDGDVVTEDRGRKLNGVLKEEKYEKRVEL